MEESSSTSSTLPATVWCLPGEMIIQLPISAMARSSGSMRVHISDTANAAEPRTT